MATEEQGVLEVARRMLVLALFGAWLFIRTKSGDLIHFGREHWHAEQARFNAERSGLDLVLKARQIGFTTFILARDVQFACTRHGTNTVIVAHTLGAKKALFRVVRHMVDGVVKRGLIPEPSFNTVDEIVIPHTRKVVDPLTGKTSRVEVPSTIRVIEAGATEQSADDKGRSGTIHRAHFTELAFYREAKKTLTAIRGAMPKDGSAEVVIESTPNGAAGHFYEMVRDHVAGKPSPYKLHFFPWYAHEEYRRPLPDGFDPRPRDEWEERLRSKGCDDQQIQFWRERVDAPDEGGLEGALQEYPIDALSCFRMTSGAWLSTQLCDFIAANALKVAKVERITTREHDHPRPEAQWPRLDLGELRVFAEPAGEEVIASGDVAGGGGGEADYSVARVRGRRTGRLYASFRSNTIQPGDFGVALGWIGTRFGGAVVVVERNNHGAAALEALAKRRTDHTPYRRLWVAPDGKHGFHTTPTTRPALWDDWHTALKTALKSGDELRGWFDADMAEEARTLVLKAGRPEAAPGAHDDVFTADAINWHARSRVVPGTNKGDGRTYQSEADRVGSLI